MCDPYLELLLFPAGFGPSLPPVSDPFPVSILITTHSSSTLQSPQKSGMPSESPPQPHWRRRRRRCCRLSLSLSCTEEKISAEFLSLISRNLASDSLSPVRWPRSPSGARAARDTGVSARLRVRVMQPSSLMSVAEGKMTLPDLESSLFILSSTFKI